MTLTQTITRMMRFKRWANKITYSTVIGLPDGEALKKRQTRFGNMVHTLNHVYVVDDVFRAHLLGCDHDYTARNTDVPPLLGELWSKQQIMDDWWVNFSEGLSEYDLAEVVEFAFIGSKPTDKKGMMSRGDMFIHIVNHGSYHRGFVGDMLNQVGVTPPATDLPVFLRETEGS